MEVEHMTEHRERHKQWMKHLNWTHQESSRVHFFKVLMPGLNQRLSIPKKYVIEFRERLSQTAVLRGPSDDTWKVALTQTGADTVFFGHGWEKFVRDHSLETLYFLLFKYEKRDSSFHVIVLDRSGCENEEVNGDIPRVTFFYKVLLQGFHQRIAIPSKFISEFGEKLPETVVLKTPSGNAWNVGLTKTGDNMFFERSWSGFVKDNGLEEGDFLAFRYDEWDKIFHVIVFDKTACEKEGLMNANRSENAEPNADDGYAGKEKVVKVKTKIKAEPGPVIRSQTDRASLSARTTTPIEPNDCMSSVQGQKSTRVGLSRNKGIVSRNKPKSEGATKCSTSGGKIYGRYFVSQRRPVTTKEREIAFQLARAAHSTKPNFIVVMRPSHVYKRFYLTIPKELMVNITPCPEIVILRAPPSAKTWRTTVVRGSKVVFGLSGGWSNFVFDNNIEEGDACVFEMWNVGQGTTNANSNPHRFVNFDVSIFRVVDESVSLQKKFAIR